MSYTQINLEKNYFLYSDFMRHLKITTNSTFDSWEWRFQDDSVISNSFKTNCKVEDIPSVFRKFNNGISCENIFSILAIRSILLQNYRSQNSRYFPDNNYIEIKLLVVVILGICY
jgi:hypothetical protein